MGRPRKYPDGKLSKQIPVYFTERQFDKVWAYATLTGRTVNEFITGEVLRIVDEHDVDIAQYIAARKIAAKSISGS